MSVNGKIIMVTEKKDCRGGRRPGAGRPRGDAKLYAFRAGGEIAKVLDSQQDRTTFIKNSLISAIRSSGRGLSSLGNVLPADNIGSLTLPAYDVRVVAGFPVPLDNDERSQDIDILRLLCPHPEASYLVRVQGDSMIDAGICSGDIVIVDKSRRDPSEKEIAVCELNGDFTLKRIFVEKDGSKWLVPANPAFPRFPIGKEDAFRIWGTVTYIIHKARV